MATKQATTDFSNLSKSKLLDLAKIAGLPAKSRSSKDDLMSMLEVHAATAAADTGAKKRTKKAVVEVPKEFVPFAADVEASKGRLIDEFPKVAEDTPKQLRQLRRLADENAATKATALLKDAPIQGVGVITRDDGAFVGLQAKFWDSDPHRVALRGFKRKLKDMGLILPDPRAGQTPADEVVNLEEMSVDKLKEMATKLELKPGRKGKAKLIEMISAAAS